MSENLKLFIIENGKGAVETVKTLSKKLTNEDEPYDNIVTAILEFVATRTSCLKLSYDIDSLNFFVHVFSQLNPMESIDTFTKHGLQCCNPLKGSVNISATFSLSTKTVRLYIPD